MQVIASALAGVMPHIIAGVVTCLQDCNEVSTTE